MPSGVYIRSEATKQRLSEIAKSRVFSEATLEKKRLSMLGKNKQPRTEAQKEHLSKVNTGKKLSVETKRKCWEKSKKGSESHLWKGGITNKNKLARQTIEYKLWRDAVFNRDKYTCQKCKQKGIFLHAHHIKSFASHPDLRFELSNGVTLCIPCHEQTDNYKGKELCTKKQAISEKESQGLITT